MPTISCGSHAETLHIKSFTTTPSCSSTTAHCCLWKKSQEDLHVADHFVGHIHFVIQKSGIPFASEYASERIILHAVCSLHSNVTQVELHNFYSILITDSSLDHNYHTNSDPHQCVLDVHNIRLVWVTYTTDYSSCTRVAWTWIFWLGASHQQARMGGDRSGPQQNPITSQLMKSSNLQIVNRQWQHVTVLSLGKILPPQLMKRVSFLMK